MLVYFFFTGFKVVIYWEMGKISKGSNVKNNGGVIWKEGEGVD